MKVVLVHDYLNQLGGGERVLEALMEMFPDAPVYTLLYDENKTLNRFRGRVRKTSFLDFPLARHYHRLFIPLMPAAVNTMAIDHNYDFVISDSAGFAKGIKTHTGHCHSNCHRQTHIAYIHTPLRYAWEPNYLKGLIFNFQFSILKPVLWYLRKWDFKTAQKPDILIANSRFIADKIKRYYNRDAQVIYPPVDTGKFYLDASIEAPTSKERRSYLAVGRLMHYKRFDLIIEAFAKSGLPLKIVGTGPELKNLELRIKKLGAVNIEILRSVDDNELRELYNNAKALIFPQVEDFGLVAAEAQCCGCPVIAYAAGGALEIVKNNETGILFREQTADAIIAAIKDSESVKFNRAEIAEKAQKFSKERFKKEFLEIMKKLA